jgi:hypothetical protein
VCRSVPVMRLAESPGFQVVAARVRGSAAVGGCEPGGKGGHDRGPGIATGAPHPQTSGSNPIGQLRLPRPPSTLLGMPTSTSREGPTYTLHALLLALFLTTVGCSAGTSGGTATTKATPSQTLSETISPSRAPGTHSCSLKDGTRVDLQLIHFSEAQNGLPPIVNLGVHIQTAETPLVLAGLNLTIEPVTTKLGDHQAVKPADDPAPYSDSMTLGAHSRLDTHAYFRLPANLLRANGPPVATLVLQLSSRFDGCEFSVPLVDPTPTK